MIDPKWLARVSALIGVQLPGDGAVTLADRLQELDEVLPHLVITAGGLRDWPLARAALLTAGKSHTRPTQMRPTSMGAVASGRAVSDLRRPMNAYLMANSVNRNPDWEECGPTTADLARMLRLARLESSRVADSPEMFIGFEG